jgi:hypothetical protein
VADCPLPGLFTMEFLTKRPLSLAINQLFDSNIAKKIDRSASSISPTYVTHLIGVAWRIFPFQLATPIKADCRNTFNNVQTADNFAKTANSVLDKVKGFHAYSRASHLLGVMLDDVVR